MSRRALIIALGLSLPALAAERPTRGRGPLTLLGAITLSAGLGVGGAGLATLLAADANRALFAPYDSNAGSEDSAIVVELDGGIRGGVPVPGRMRQQAALGITLLGIAGGIAGAGALLLVLDSLLAGLPLHASVVPTSNGVWAAIGARF